MKCTHCGRCCQVEVCEAGKIAYGKSTKPPCPALTEENGIYLCEIVLTERAFFSHTLISDALGIGVGCTNEEYTEQLNQLEERQG